MAEGFITRRGGVGEEPFEPIQATGGTVSDVNINNVNYRIHTFTNVGNSTFNVTNAGSDGKVEYLVVAGGGGSGTDGAGGGGGGGAGGYLCSVFGEQSGGPTAADFPVIVNEGSINVTVGAGGQAKSLGSNGVGENGKNSVFGSVVAIGGGGGIGAGGNTDNFDVATRMGGSGGGAWCLERILAANPAELSGFFRFGTQGQGNNGGLGRNSVPSNSNQRFSAGGGGASQPGEDTRTDRGANGGNGIFSSINGTSTARGGGGASGTRNTGQPQGSGGVGGGGNRTQNGTPNTGGGGGGSVGGSIQGGDGGSGIVIIRYPLEAA